MILTSASYVLLDLKTVCLVIMMGQVVTDAEMDFM